MDTDLVGELLLRDVASQTKFLDGSTQRLRPHNQVLVEISGHNDSLQVCRDLSTPYHHAVMSRYFDEHQVGRLSNQRDDCSRVSTRAVCKRAIVPPTSLPPV